MPILSVVIYSFNAFAPGDAVGRLLDCAGTRVCSQDDELLDAALLSLRIAVVQRHTGNRAGRAGCAGACSACEVAVDGSC